MKNPVLRHGFRLIATFGPALVVCLFGLLAYSAARYALRSTTSVARTFEVTAELNFLLQRIVDAETAQRGYLVTGDSAFLSPLQGADSDVAAGLARIFQLISDPLQQEKLDSIVPMMERRLALINGNVGERARTGSEPADLDLRLEAGRVLMDTIRANIADMTSVQTALVTTRQAREQAGIRRFVTILATGGALAALLAVLTNIFFARAARAEALANETLREQADDLAEQNEQLENQAVELELQAVELEEATDSLRESEQRFRALIENNSDVLAIVDAKGTLLYTSPNTESVFGHDVHTMVGVNRFTFLHPEDVEQIADQYAEVARTPGERRVLNYRFRHADGLWRHMETIVHNMLHIDGVDGVVANTRDITDRLQAEAELSKSQEQLLQAQKMEAIGRLAGGIAHDFNNLLTIINGNVEMLISAASTDSVPEELTDIADAGERARALTRQLLAFSRKQIISPAPLNLSAVVRETERILRRVIGEDIEFRCRLADDLHLVLADPGQVDQILMNLVVNARDAMPLGGKLTIETRNTVVPTAADDDAADNYSEESPAVLLAVSDTGSGMDRRTQSRIFEPFFTTKPAGQGTGLGLSTVYGIVKRSGGDIHVYSEPGQGTAIKIYFPATDVVPRAEEDVGVATLAPGAASVLVVEDEVGVRKLTERILRHAGYSVRTAGSAQEAINVAAEWNHQVDVLITDVVMPGMSGRGLADELATKIPGLRLLFMSGYTDDAIVHHGVLDAGIDFLEKPFSPQRLLVKVQEVLRRNPARADVR